MSYLSNVKDYLEREKALIDQLDQEALAALVQTVMDAYERDANVYIFGNGGSGATASHWVNDFNKGVSEYTPKPFRFFCLNDNMPTVLSIANDIGYDQIFSFQLKGKVTADDVVIGISGSGNSANVLNAIEVAKAAGAYTVGLCGYDGGKLKGMVDLPVHAPVMNMQLTEDIHMILCHMVMTAAYAHFGVKGH